MARRTAPDTEVVLQTVNDPGSPARRRSADKGKSGGSIPWLYFAIPAAMLVVTIALAWAYYTVEQFLITDPRFTLPAPADLGPQSPKMRVEGIRNASRGRILRLFEQDYGRSIYLLPLRERRIRLLAVDWVKEASVSRIWPNRVVVRIVERTPVAFVALRLTEGPAPFRYALIDSEGVVLDPRTASPYQLPVLTGIMAGETETQRREKVRRMEKFFEEIGPQIRSKVSEIDVTDPDNLKIIMRMEERGIQLHMGDVHYAKKLNNFLAHYEDIHARLPGATVLDLRLEDRITALEGAKNVE